MNRSSYASSQPRSISSLMAGLNSKTSTSVFDDVFRPLDNNSLTSRTDPVLPATPLTFRFWKGKVRVRVRVSVRVRVRDMIWVRVRAEVRVRVRVIGIGVYLPFLGRLNF